MVMARLHREVELPVARERTASGAGASQKEIADAVRRGLRAEPKSLPAFLFYDAEGSRIYEQITELPEYYLTRTERSIFEQNARAIVDAAAGDAAVPLNVIELGAGTATKSEILLRAALQRQGRTLFVPVDVSASALDIARARIRASLPEVQVRPLHMTHDDALATIRRIPQRRLVMFIGSSIGNYDDSEATALLARLSAALAPGDALLLGADFKKSPDVLIPAYDDAAGVTAAFNKNVLARINRELGGRFDLDRFRHVARWNVGASRIEMHLESLADQVVAVDTLGLRVPFRRGETIHTESSVKYDEARIDALFAASGFARERTFTDDARRFGVHIARRV
jgi:dimethylhistidine N-methyltransferase